MQELKLKSRRVLEAVYDNGGEAITPEIKEQTGIEKSATLRYHAENVLEDRGLVECHMESTEEHPAGVRHVEITEEGRERIAHLFDGTDDIPISDRMNKIEDRFHETEGHVSELVGEIEEIEETAEFASEVAQDADVKGKQALSAVEELSEKIDDFGEQLETLGSHVERIDGMLGDIQEENPIERIEMIETHRLRDMDTRLSRLEDTLSEAVDEGGNSEGEEISVEENSSETEDHEPEKRTSDMEKIRKLLEPERWKRRVRDLDTTEELRELLEGESLRPTDSDLKQLAEEYDLDHTEASGGAV